MVEIVERVLEKADRKACWLVGVSGGRDSIALLEMLVRAGFSSLVIVHVNHMLRGEESDKDEVFVRELAARCGVAFYSESVDVQLRMTEEGKGLELAAREARHGVYANALQKYDAEGVLLGHHADDQAETVLYNVLRGSNGLKGIREDSRVNVGGVELRIFRPMLRVRRAEIDSYVAKYEIEYREDASNSQAVTARNRIRNEVVPLLTDIMQREVVPNINAAAEVSLELSDYLATEVKLEKYLDPQGRVFVPAVRELPPVLQQSVLFQFLKSQRVEDVSRSLVSQAIELCNPEAAAKINLPGGDWLRRKEQRLFIERG